MKMKKGIIISVILIIACNSDDLQKEFDRIRDQRLILEKSMDSIRNRYRHEGETIYYDEISKEDQARIDSLLNEENKLNRRQQDIILER